MPLIINPSSTITRLLISISSSMVTKILQNNLYPHVHAKHHNSSDSIPIKINLFTNKHLAVHMTTSASTASAIAIPAFIRSASRLVLLAEMTCTTPLVVTCPTAAGVLP